LKTIVHVHQAHIRHNRKTSGKLKPVFTAKDYKQNRKGNTVIILDNEKREVARLIYSPEKPLKCGAVAWLSTENEVLVDA